MLNRNDSTFTVVQQDWKSFRTLPEAEQATRNTKEGLYAELDAWEIKAKRGVGQFDAVIIFRRMDLATLAMCEFGAAIASGEERL